MLQRSKILEIKQQHQEPPSQQRQREQQQLNFGEFEDHSFDTIDYDELMEEEMSVETVNTYSTPPLSNEFYQLTILTAHAIKNSLSGAKIADLVATMSLLFDNNLIITAKMIEAEKENWISEFAIRETIFCGAPECKKSLPKTTSICPCGAPKDDKATVSCGTILPHVLNIVRKYEDELLRQREPTIKRADLVDYIGNKFENNCLQLDFILNTDGVQPKQNSRKPFHPVFLMIKNLRGATRSTMKNILLSAIIFGKKSPYEWLWKYALSTLASDMEKLKNGIPFVCKNGTQILIKGNITDVCIDQIASQMVYQHSSHAAFGFGCTVCDVFPVREENGQRWPLKSGNLRETDDNRIGLAVVETAFSAIAPHSLMRLDGLHILDEGLVKTLLNLLFAEFKIAAERIRLEINRAMLKNGSSALVLKSNAHEMRRLFAICVPILFLQQSDNQKLQVACLFWLFCRILYSKYLNTIIIDDLQPVFEDLGENMGNVLGNSFRTIKGHKLLSHGGAELKAFGTPADFSAAAFECANRWLKVLIDPRICRGFDNLLQRKHLQQAVMELKIEEMASLLNLDPQQFRHFHSTPAKNYISQSVNYKGPLLPLMNENEKTFYSTRQNAFTHQFNPAKGTFSFFKATLDGNGACYKSFIGIERNGEKFLLSQKLKTFNPITADLFMDSLKGIAEILTKYQFFVFEIVEEENDEFVLIPFKNVISFVILVEFENRKYLVDVSERFNKT